MRPASIGPVKHLLRRVNLQDLSNILNSEIDSGSANGNTTLKQENQIITGDMIEYKKYPESSGVSYSAKGNVTINEDGRIATCGEANYDRQNGKTSLRINPKIIDNDQTISGNVLKTYFATP